MNTPAAQQLQSPPAAVARPGKGFLQDLEVRTLANEDFRRVLYTSRYCQLVVMSLRPGEDIGEEEHQLDQFFRFEAGTGSVVLDGAPEPVRHGVAVLVPAGVRHNIVNTGATPLKLSTLYAPPSHRDGVVHHTRADATGDDEHFDLQTTEFV
ncbi:MAG: cupin domain-containing protein [Myxococcales bacterium]|nr:cupin domain-containing protein [Myxococcales bacterium]